MAGKRIAYEVFFMDRTSDKFASYGCFPSMPEKFVAAETRVLRVTTVSDGQRKSRTTRFFAKIGQ